jgi:ankyrin repeat protein
MELVKTVYSNDVVHLASLLNKTNVNYKCPQDEGNTLLMQASGLGYNGIVTLLLDRNADLEIGTDLNGATALMLAAIEGHLTTVKLLLDRGADINKRNSNDADALDFAMNGGDMETIFFFGGKNRFNQRSLRKIIQCNLV